MHLFCSALQVAQGNVHPIAKSIEFAASIGKPSGDTVTIAN